jgi:hypothetical protein
MRLIFRLQLSEQSEHESTLQTQARALTDMARSLLSHVESVQQSAEAHPFEAGVLPSVAALKSEVAFATEALTKLSAEVCFVICIARGIRAHFDGSSCTRY